MISVEEAQDRMIAEVRPGESEAVALSDSLARVLREDVIATADAPERDNSAMDGYALRAEDIIAAPVRLRVVGDVAAGHLPARRVESGTALRIMTGAFVPEGADTVVPVELTDGGTETVSISKSLRAGANIRRRGEDLRAGDRVLTRGVPIGPAEVAMLAAADRQTVIVGKRPTVAILTTGDELVDVGQPRAPGQIVNTNAHLLAALVTEAGAVARPLGIVRDSREATITALESATACDYIVSSGGVSVGAYDFVKEALEALGAETKFWRVAMKPGKPIVLSRLRNRLFFGLPGNPAACLVSFHLFVAPALRKAMGQEVRVWPVTVRARTTGALRATADRRLYVRVRVTASGGELIAEPLTSQGSGSLTSMVGANGLAVIEHGSDGIEPGESVAVLLIGAVA